jgi:hypothetical protein
MNEDNMPEKKKQYKREGRRAMGKHKKRWIQQITEDNGTNPVLDDSDNFHGSNQFYIK